MRQRIRGFWDSLHRRVSCCSTAHFSNPLFSLLSPTALVSGGGFVTCGAWQPVTPCPPFAKANQWQAIHSDPLISQMFFFLHFDRLMYFLQSWCLFPQQLYLKLWSNWLAWYHIGNCVTQKQLSPVGIVALSIPFQFLAFQLWVLDKFDQLLAVPSQVEAHIIHD